MQVQNRLDAAQEARRGLQEQLTELKAAIATEKAGRSESVRRLSFDLFRLMDPTARPKESPLWNSCQGSKKTSREWRKSSRTMVSVIQLKFKRRKGLSCLRRKPRSDGLVNDSTVSLKCC